MVFEKLQQDLEQLPLRADGAQDVPGPQVGDAGVGAGVVGEIGVVASTNLTAILMTAGNAVDRFSDSLRRQLFIDKRLRSDRQGRSIRAPIHLASGRRPGGSGRSP